MNFLKHVVIASEPSGRMDYLMGTFDTMFEAIIKKAELEKTNPRLLYKIYSKNVFGG